MAAISFFNPAVPTALDEHDAKQLLQQYHVPVVDEFLVADADQAVEAAGRIHFPVVLKGIGTKLLHKTEMGLVHVHLNDAQAVRRAARDIQAKAGDLLEGLLVQPHIGGQRELMAGLFMDPEDFQSRPIRIDI